MSRSLAIGQRNVEPVVAAAAAGALRAAAADTGGNVGRSVRLDVASGRMQILRCGGEVPTL